ncbi:MAG: NAD(P)-dependent oxidoreductase [Candidatus Methanofastidiosia archaeon]
MEILIGGKYTKKEKFLYKQLLGDQSLHFLDEGPPVCNISGTEILLVPSWREVAPLIPKMNNLYFIQFLFAGVDRIDFSVIPDKILVASCSGSNAASVTEHAFALLLSLSKNLTIHQNALRSGIFSQLSPLNMKLAGKNIGIIGYGTIGKRIGAIAKILDMKTYAVNTSGESDADVTVTLDNLHDIIPQLDYIIITLALTKKTRNVITRKELEAMKDNAILVNVARGGIVNEKDLYEHLLHHPEFKAGIDVWWHYPKKNEQWKQKYPIETLPNVQITPHNAAMVDMWKEEMIQFCCENVRRFVNKKEVKNKVKKEDYLI